MEAHAAILRGLVITSTEPALAWIPALPLAAFAVLILAGRRLGRLSAWLSVAALAGAFLLTLSIAGRVFQGERLAIEWAWLSATDRLWSVGLTADGLSWLMLIVVTAIGTMIQLYSIGYMREDPRVSRFFAYLSLFCFSMLLLVLADHFVLLYAGWELVGLSSYLLISFWFEKPAAAAAGRKAFLTTRIGDCGLLLGILLLAWHGHELRFARLDAVSVALSGQPGLLTLIGALIFFGAAGKSAQFPLHVWLPDAMEGPTPVSALIHAATMVAAGVYLIARTHVLFTPESLALVAAVGLTTHLFAGSIALVATDIKKVLAYSTISQLGLMFTALGLGAPAVGMFHLFTHAFFKALLFLGAGSVIHATHAQELDQLGGLRRAMPWTAGLFAIATLSACGVFPLSGFWSKDAILLEAQLKAPLVFALLSAGAVMTAAYMTRLYLRCFEGPSPQHGAHHAHESPSVMVLPMAMLGLGAVVAGLAGSPWTGNGFFHLLDAHGHEHVDAAMLLTSTLIAAAGIGLGWQVGFRRRTFMPQPLRGFSGAWYRAAAGKYFIDELYGRVIVQPFLHACAWLARFDVQVVDGAVNGAGAVGWRVGQLKGWFDTHVVDGLVNRVAAGVRRWGTALRPLQSGVIQQYLLLMVAAVVACAVALTWTKG